MWVEGKIGRGGVDTYDFGIYDSSPSLLYIERAVQNIERGVAEVLDCIEIVYILHQDIHFLNAIFVPN